MWKELTFRVEGASLHSITTEDALPTLSLSFSSGKWEWSNITTRVQERLMEMILVEASPRVRGGGRGTPRKFWRCDCIRWNKSWKVVGKIYVDWFYHLGILSETVLCPNKMHGLWNPKDLSLNPGPATYKTLARTITKSNHRREMSWLSLTTDK